MANGTMIGCLQYYTNIGETEVASRYSGNAGTSTNPYAVEDIFDLDNIVIRGIGIEYFQLVADIDYNNHPSKRYGIDSGYMWGTGGSGGSGDGYYLIGLDPITGNNHEIRNIVILNKDVVCNNRSVGAIKNINFVNMIFKNVNYSSDYFWYAPLTNCNFSLMFINSSPGRFFRTDKYTDCSFNIYGTNNMSNTTSDYTFNLGAGDGNAKIRCHFNFNNFVYNCIGSPVYLFWAQGNGYNAVVKDCYFTGSIKLKGHSTGASVRITTDISLYNSYFAISLSSISGSLGYCLFTNPGSTSFIDKVVLGLTINDSSSNLAKLTTAQAKSYSYVSGIGFPVIPAGD